MPSAPQPTLFSLKLPPHLTRTDKLRQQTVVIAFMATSRSLSTRATFPRISVLIVKYSVYQNDMLLATEKIQLYDVIPASMKTMERSCSGKVVRAARYVRTSSDSSPKDR